MKPDPEECMQENASQSAEANGEQSWHSLEVGEIFNLFNTAPDRGLNSEEVSQRLEVCGPNEIREAPRPGLFNLILDQFNNFIVIVLIIASIISAVIGDYVEALAILAIVLLLVFVAFFKYTRWGLSMQATADDETAALSLGVSARFVYAAAWSIAFMSAGVGGALLGNINGINI